MDSEETPAGSLPLWLSLAPVDHGQAHEHPQARKRARRGGNKATASLAGLAEPGFLSLGTVGVGDASQPAAGSSSSVDAMHRVGANELVNLSGRAAPVAVEPILAVPLQAMHRQFDVPRPSRTGEASSGVANAIVMSTGSSSRTASEPVCAVPFQAIESLQPSRSSGGGDGETSNGVTRTGPVISIGAAAPPAVFKVEPVRGGAPPRAVLDREHVSDWSRPCPSNGVASNEAAATSSSSAAAPATAEPMDDAVPQRAANAPPADASATPHGGAQDPGVAEPAWIRAELLPLLHLRGDLPLHFIATKRVQPSDLSSDQSRFSISKGDVDARLRPLLSAGDRQAANLDQEAPKKPATKQHDRTEEGRRRRKEKGKDHGGLKVCIVGRAGIPVSAALTRWGSSCQTVLKGVKEFLRGSGLVVEDEVEIWAFRGEPGGKLWLVITKTDGEQHPPAVAAEPAPDALLEGSGNSSMTVHRVGSKMP